MWGAHSDDPEGSWHIICTLHSGWCIKYSSKDHEKPSSLWNTRFSSNTTALESHQLSNEVTRVGVAIQYILPRWPDMSFPLPPVPSHFVISKPNTISHSFFIQAEVSAALPIVCILSCRLREPQGTAMSEGRGVREGEQMHPILQPLLSCLWRGIWTKWYD